MRTGTSPTSHCPSYVQLSLETPTLSIAVTATSGVYENHPPGSGAGVKESAANVGPVVSRCGAGAEPGTAPHAASLARASTQMDCAVVSAGIAHSAGSVSVGSSKETVVLDVTTT